MKPRLISAARLSFALASSIAALLAAPAVRASTLTWDTAIGDGAVITDGSGTWSNLLGNWNDAGANVNWANGTPDSALFGGGTAGTFGTVTLGTAITAGNLTFNTPNGGGAYTINTSTFGLTLNTGITANESATIQSGGGGSIILGATNAWSVAATKTLAVSSAISGTGFGIAKTGDGTLTLSGANTFNGGVTLSSGTLGINSAGVAGTSGPLGNGGTFTIDGGTIDNTSGAVKVVLNVNPITVGGNFAHGSGLDNSGLTLPGTVNLGGATRTITVNGIGTTRGLIFTGVLSNGTGLTKNGTGALVLTSNASANTYTGVTTVNAGILRGTALAASATPSNAFGSTALQLNGGTLEFRAHGAGSNGTITYGNNVTVGGSATIFVRNPNTTGGNTGNTIQLGTLSIGANNFLNVTNANTYKLHFEGATTLTGNANFSIPNTTSLTLFGAIGDGGSGYSLTTYDLGVLRLLGANTYSGTTTIYEGYLALLNPLALQNSTLDTTASEYNSLRTTVTTLTFGGLSGEEEDSQDFDRTFAFGTMFDNGYDFVTALTLNPGVGASPSYFGIIGDGAIGMTLTKTGVGTQTLSGANTYTGATTISAGTLTLGHALALQNSPLDTAGSVAGAANVGLRTTVTTLTLGGLTGNKNFAATGGVFETTSGGYTAVTALTLNPGVGATPSYSGIIADGATGMTLTKTGTGTQTLSGPNTYSGDTTVSAGTLTISSAPDPLNANTGNDASTFTIADTSATLNLTFTGTDLVDKLFIGASQKDAGVYGHTNSGATNGGLGVGALDAYFGPGTGTLTVGTTNYASWIDGFFPGETDPLIIGAEADPDFDGIPNGVEMVVGGDPKDGMDSALLPTLELVNADPDGDTLFADYLLFTYRRTDLSVAAGVTADCETDTDLVAPWTAATGAPGVVIQVDDNFTFSPPAAAATDRVRVYVPRGSQTTLFGRLNVLVP